MTTRDFIASLAERQIELFVSGGQLRFRAPDAALTEEIRAQIRERRAALLEELAETPDAERQDPSEGQAALWFLHQLDPRSTAYNTLYAARLAANVDISALRLALDATHARHELLRGRFGAADGKPFIDVGRAATAPLEIVDAAGWTVGEIDRFIAARADEPFDLEHGPVARWHLLTGATSGTILALVAHHIVVDFRSLEVVLRDVTDAYLSIAAGGPQPLQDLAGRYRDYVRRQQQWIRSERGLAAQSWWTTQLAAPLPVLDLPSDFGRPATQDYSGQTLIGELDAGLTTRVKQFAKDHLVTPNSVLLGAFSLLLSRYARQDELLIGVPMLGRTGADEQEVVGYFVNPVVLRLTTNALADAVAHVQSVHRASLDAMTHQAYPFPRLVDDLNIARDASRSPLFQVAFVYERESGVPLEKRGLFDGVVSGGQRGAVFDVTLTALERDGAFRLTWEYATALFRPSTIERMSSQFAQLVGELVSRPRDEVRRLSILSDDDAARLARWNGAGLERPVEATLADRFAAQVAATPNQVAIETPSHRWTYAELDARANAIAARLLSLGVTVNVPVALALERGPEAIAAVVAVMKAGGACVPVDISHPRERVRFMLQQSNAQVLIADQATAGRLPEHTSTLIRIEEIETSQGRTLVPDCPAGSDDLLYVLYTSGSTGQPKGVAVPHRTLVNLLDWQRQQPGLDRPARTMQYAPLTFDVAFQEIATALCTGGSLLLIDDESRRDSRLLVEWIARHRVERLHIPFVALQHLAEAAPAGLPECLRDVITAGEQLRITPAISTSFGLSRARLHNHYGPTESHVVTAWPLPEQVIDWEALPPIGRPIANTQMHVLGPQGEAQPIGVPGELWIGGAPLAVGYLNRPDLTAERFIQHPLHGRIYKTGDVGRWRDDGALEYLGRTDNQVKLRGFRVELEEIEAVLNAHASVVEAAVTLIGDGESKQLAGFVGVGPHSSAREVRAQILQHLREQLPDYMVPARITVRERLPQTSSGKIDRRSLAALPYDEEPGGPAQSGARTETERTLQAIWASLLGVERPGVHASFFDLGGHSLRAARLVARIRSSLAVDLPLRAVFEAPTIHALALRVDALRGGEVLPPLEPAPADVPLQLSFGQQRLWLLDQLEGPSATYSIPAALQLEGPLRVDALRRAFATIVARHAGLRLVFPAISGRPQVRVVEPYDPLAVTDLSTLEPEVRQTEADRLQRQHTAQPFDLARGPLLRAHVLRLAEESHVLLFGMHHIISDGWSLGVLLDELRAFYEADVLGRSADVRPLTVQYPDYAAWQRQWLRGDVLDRQLAYWTRQLTGAPPLLELPADYPRPAQQRYRGGIYRQQVSRAALQRLRRFNVTHESTAFMTLLSVFQLLLSQHSGQDEVCVGTPVANRRLDATEGLIGFFVNTLVMRARIDPAANFDALLAAVRATSLDAFTHQDLPFELLVDALQPQRSLSHSPLFQAMFVMVDAAAQRLGLKDVGERLLPASLAAAKFDLTLYVEERGDDAELTWEYDADLFAPERITRMAGHFAELLSGVLATPEAPLATLPMLTPPEQLQITEWGRGPSVEREWPSVMAAVAAQVHRAPDRIALVCGQTRVTYRELNARANRIARLLQAEGIGRGQVVAICLQRGVDMVASVLGTLKAGAAYLPLDPTYPAARLGFILDDAGAAMVISDSSIASVVDAKPARACWIDRDAARIAALSGEDLPGTPGPDDWIYVIYTSGSTGQPKGAAVRHGAFANLVQWYGRELELGDTDRVLLVSALGFDLTQKNLFAPLIAGGTLCIPESETYDPAALRAQIEAQQITWVNCTPSAFYPLVDRHEASVWRSLATLRWVVLGGEPIDVSRLRPWLSAAAGRARVLNSYGPTECTDICLVWAFDGETPDEVIPLGRPIPNMRLAVLDAAGRPVPVGLPGELWIGGAGVGAGYLHRPELNAAAFRDVTVFGETLRMYRSGDRVRWRPDGVLDYLGRGDHQVKLRGFRIELGEIESALRSVPGVAEAVAVVRERDGHAALVAYVVAADHATTAVILQQAVAALPAYMVPSQVVRLARMPLTPHGKVDRLGLPDPDEQPSSPVDVPVTATETQLARTWGELLGITAVGRHADFFASGGHSLLATRLVARIADEFGVELPLRSLFEHPTLAGVAAVIDERQAPLRPAIGPRPSDEPAVLSFAQERLWFLDQLEPGGTAYSIPAALDLSGPLDIPALTRALSGLVARHDILRLRIVSRGGTPSPRLLPPYDPLTVEDVSDASDPQAEADRIGREHAGRPFDLESGPLFRSHLVTLGPERHRLLFNLHHIISDGWSVDLLIRDLAALYAGHRQGKTADLPALPLRYTDYSRWQREQVSARAAEQLAYWREQLRDAPERLELPVDFPRAGLRQHEGGEVHLSIEPALAARLEGLARAEGSTLFMGLLAAFSVLLYRASAQKDICIGTPVAYRPSLELEHVAGLFLNTLVVRTRIAAGATFLDVLADVRKSALGAYANQDVPFEYLVEQLQPQRSLSHTPLFQVMLNLVNTRTEPPRLDGMAVTEVTGSLGLLAKFDLSLSLTVRDDGGLDGRLEYNAGLFAGETVAFLAECFQALLRQVVEQPNRPLAAISMLAASTSAAVIAPAPARPAVDFGSIERSIPSRFAEQVRARPDAIAVCTPAARVTYRELDQQARRVAAALMAGSAGRAVALLLPHDATMAIGILGTLQSGRMYVPLDASHPIERLLQIAADAEISAVVSCAGLDPLARRLAGPSCPVIDVDNPGTEAAEHLPAVSPDSIAYLLYTSGSTGTPKGVIQNHRNVLHFIREYTERLRIESGDRVLQVASYAFDAAVMDLFGALLNGATLFPIDLKQQTVREACDWIAGQAITIYHSTPTVFRLLCEGLHPSTSLGAGREVPAVRLVVLGGEAATRADFEAFQQFFGAGCLFVNGLGPTESTVTLQMFLARDARLVRGSVPVGYPVANTGILLVDADGEPTELCGEIVIRSPHVALGYWQRDSAAFSDDPSHSGQRRYRTGDLARLLPDGSLEALGRRDGQIKLRGFRIELGEIESALRRHPAVTEAAVVVWPALDDDLPAGAERMLAAYVSGGVAQDELKAWLRDTLPDYMVPAAIAVLDRLPVTPNGKLDRRNLPDPVVAVPGSDDVALATDAERTLADLWSDVLARPVTNRTASFFDLGGHSLVAARLVARIRERLGVEAPLRLVFEQPVLHEQAAAIERYRTGPVRPPIEHRPQAPVTLTAAQQRLWFLAEREGAALGAAYTISAALGVDGALDEAALRRALIALTARHDGLRINVRNVDGSPAVTLRDPYDPLQIVSLSEAATDETLARVALAHAAAPFDLAAEPLLRLTLVRDPDESPKALLFSIHHLIADGWSLSVLVQELATLYAGAPLSPPPITMADYAVWERQWLTGPERTRQLAYWRMQLAEAPALLELPTDLPRPAVKTYRGAQIPVQLHPDLVTKLRAVGQAEGATLAMTVQAGLIALLHRYSAATDIVVGSPVAQRPQRETEGLIGLLVNTVALRTPVDGAESFGALVRRVRQVALDAYGHADVPFDQLVEELQPARSLSYSPVYQVMCAVQTMPVTAVKLGEAVTRTLAVDRGTAKVDLLLSVGEEAGALAGVWEYRTDLWEAATIARLARHFETLLAGAVAAPETPVGQLPLLTPGEADALGQWTSTATVYPRDVGIHTLVAAQADERPDAVALIAGGESVSYRELVTRARQLAGWLQAHGVAHETPVGVCLDRSANLIVSFLAILEAGGAYVPLDPAYPPERLAHLVADTGLSVVLATTATSASLSKMPGVTVLCLDEAAGEIAAAPPLVPVAVTGASLAYLMYTSGSTGQPKGVAVPHRAIARLVLAQNYIAMKQDDVVLHHSSIAFDASTFEVWAPLLTGGKLVLCEERRPSLADLRRLIDMHAVTTVWLTSGLFTLAVDHDLDALRGLRYLLAGGDVLSVPHVQRAVAALTHGTVINGYGPTENTTFSCCAPITNADLVRDTVPIGRPIANTDAYVLDREQQLAPIGIPGELYVGGDGLARGYWRDEALTQARFVEVTGFGRLYRTGDRCRWRADGQLEFLGRVDMQVKLRGFRIEPGEIEAVLRREPGVRDAIVLVVGDSDHRRLVAYVSGLEPSIDGPLLRGRLQQQLPAFMVPAQVVVLDELPLNANGKVDRARLPAAPVASARALSRPLTPIEELLAGVWAEVLQAEVRDADADFFALGGHSLMAMQVVARIRAAFGVEVPIATVFAAPSLKELAEAIAGASQARRLPSITHRVGAKPSLTAAQTRMWFLSEREGQALGSTYTIHAALGVEGVIDEQALRRALVTLTARHDSLRVNVRNVAGTPVVNLRDPYDPLTVTMLTAAESLELPASLLARARAHGVAPFDIATEPLLRLTLVQDATGAACGLLFSIHHLIADGWSLSVLVQELAALYAGDSLAPLPVTMADYAAWEREWLAGPERERQLAYWRTQLADAPALVELPTDSPRPAVKGYAGAQVPVVLRADLVSRLRTVGQAEGATLAMTVLAGLAALLHRYSSATDIVIGTPVAQRPQRESEGLIGLLVNTVALRTTLTGKESFRNLLRSVRQVALEAYGHADVPFDQLLDELRPVRSLSYSPIYQVMCAVQTAPNAPVKLGTARTRPLNVDPGTAKVDLLLNVADQDGALVGVWEYRTDLWSHETIARLARHFERLLEDAAAAPDTTVNQLPLLPPVEAAQLTQWCSERITNNRLTRDADALRQRVTNATASHSAREWTETELALASLWTDVLRSAPGDPHADFFDCGGNSLLAMQLVARVRAEFQVDVPIALIFETPGLGEIAAAIAASGGPRETDSIPRLDAAADRPLSFAQERLWFLAQLEPDNPFYNSPLAIRIQGALDRDALAGALQDIVDRHDVLRTAFVGEGGRPRQVVREVAPFVLVHETIALEAQPPSRQAAKPSATHIESLIHERARVEAAKPFDLANPPLLRAVLLTLDAGQHVLLLTMHHIVTDGWSLGVMTRELAHFYRVRQGDTSTLAPLTVQYADFAAWQRQRLAGERFAQHLDYWRGQLAGAPPTLSLPADRVRPAVQQFRGGSIRFAIDDATREGLHRIARERNATLFMTLLGAFATLLYRHSGQHDIVIGSPIANRQHQDLEQLLGFFVNTLALRVDLSGSPRFVDLLDRIQRLTLEGYAHQDLPFEKLVDELQPERDLSRSPLFQVMFALQNAPMDAANVSGLQFSSIQIERRAALFDLVLDMWETPSGLTGVLEYNRDLFDQATAERMIRHLQTLIASIVADATTGIDTAVIVDADEQRELLALSNGPRHDYPVDRSYAAAFEEQVASAPEREAAVDEHERVTYRELNARANRVAHALTARGIGPGIPVAVFLPRGIEYLAAVLGVVKAGGVFVPVDVAYPAERVRHMLEDSGCPVVLSDVPRSGLLERLSPVALGAKGEQSTTAAEIVLVNALDGDYRNPPIANGPRDALYMIYTSGSTGLPKGALVRHDGALNHIYAEFRLLDFTARSAFLQSAPASSDISVWQCLAPLLAGGRTVFANFDVMVSPPALLTLIQRERVTLIELVPAVLDALVSHAASLPGGAGELPDLHHVMVTGEAAPVPLVNRCHAMWPRVPIVNAYGPTEAADDVCQGVVAAPLDASCTTVPIGVPIDNMSVMVLDAQRQLAPIGVPGEIAVSGVGVGAGYWRQPERTAAAFVPNLHAERTFGDTIYRTGDLGRWRHDGSLEFIGRVDQQVKIRGFRVELGEIEAVIARHSSVRAAVVIDVEREPGDRQIVAYVQPESDAGTSSNLMQEQVAGWKGLHDESYADDRVLAARPTFNTIGWDSTYTGEPLTDREMRECVANAVTRIRSLRPTRLLEIGCGTGLLLYRLAGRGFDYCGTDLSDTAIRQLDDRRRQRASRGLEQVRLMCRAADDFSDFTPGEFDAVALNSVVQYFPSAGYLQEVLRGAAKVCDGRGAIFVGDVRSLPLLRSYYASVQVAKAAGSVTASRLAATINEHIAREQELLIAPRFFDEAARQLSAASPRLQPKRGRVHNELTRFRYDAMLPLGDVNDGPPSPAECWTDWRAESWSLADIGRYLAEVRPEYWGLRHISNARLRDERGMLEWLAQAPPGATVTELREWLSATGARRRDVDPESLWQLAKQLPYRVDVVVEPDGEAGEFAVLFSHRDSVPVSASLAPGGQPGVEWQPLTSNPLQEKLGRRVIPELREHLRETLPGHMIPQSIVVLDRFPLLPNGKVDRGSLPMPASDADRRTEHVAPRTPTEAVVHAVWSEVLGVADPGAHDNFFALGGHSLKASQVISRLQQRGKQASLRDVFNHPTLAELATAIDRQQGVDPAQQIAPTPLAADYRTSAAQRRLWVLAQIGGSAAYNMADAVRLRGRLDADALVRAFDGLLRRHESLRTSFVERDGELRQVVSDKAPAALAVVNLETEPDPMATARARAVAHASALHDLSQAPLLRAELLRLSSADHVLLVNMHHIVSDGWSMDVLIRDVMTMYDAAVRGGSDLLLPLPIQHRDYVAWQEERLRDRRETDLRYWVERLRGAAPLDLPTDAPRPAEKTYAGARRQRRIPRRMAEQLAAFAKAEGVTPSMLLTALVKVLLHRHSGQSDVSVGCPVAGRPHPQLEAQVGFFVNTLVLRDEMDGAMPFVEFLARVRETVTGALAHQDVPFDWVVNELKPARDASRNPLFDVMVAVQNTANESLRFAQVEASSLGLDYGVAQFDLLWSFTDSPDGLFLDLRYNADLFRPDTIDAIVDQWQTLAAGALARPSTPVARLPLAGADERARLTAIPDSFREPVVTGNLADAFDAQASRTPDAIALRDGDRSLTYAELQRWVTYAASGIRRQLDAAGRGRGALLGICLHRSVEQVVAILATLKAGAGYVPLDPDAPAARLAFIRQDAGVPFVVTHGRTAGITGGDELALHLPPKAGAESWRAPVIAAADPAYVIYTSGSTGEPKGVVVSHANVLRLFASTSQWFGFGPGDVWTLFHSYAFDFSVWEIWGALLHGGRLVIVPYAVSRDPEECYRLISREQVTVLNQTPSAFRQLLHSDAALRNELPLALRYVIFGGEALHPSELAPWFERHGDRAPQLVNMYGITETTVHVTYRPLTKGDASSAFSPIGEPIPDLYLLVLDPHQEPVPVGVPGELYVGGAGLANGYWQRDSLTSERFVPDPFHAGRRLYRTGDRVRTRRTGELEYLGRVDTQVKIRGHRVELGEIASVIARHPGVREAVVVARSVAGQASPLAYYVAAGGPIDAQELRRHAQQSLPDYMIPLAFTALGAIPLTVNGKLDEAALPSPVTTPAVTGARRAPRTDAERRILEVWREALALDALGPDDNVFDHGAHSVLAVLVRRRLEAALGRDIPVVSLFQYPTPAALALHLDPAAAPPPDADAAIDRATARRQARRPRQRQ